MKSSPPFNFAKHVVRRALGPVYWQRLRMRMGRLPNKNELYDTWTDAVMDRVLQPTSVCLDVGCNRGKILEQMIARASQGIFHAFEPIPEFAEFLSARYGNDKRIHVHEVALSDAKGSSTFNHVLSNPGYSGLLRRRYDRPQEEDTQITVRTERLDELIGKDAKVDFIKVDVEGAEYQVFLGGKETIARNRPVIVFEHGLGGADIYGTTPQNVYELLVQDCGLQINLLDQWLLGRPALSREAFVRQFDEGINYYFIAHP